MSVRHILGISSGKDSVDRVESKPRPSREVRERFERPSRSQAEGKPKVRSWSEDSQKRDRVK
jgi:hypothetical protein